MVEEIKLPVLPLAYVPACGSTQGPGRGQLVLSHVSARACQTQLGRASTGRPISARQAGLRRNLSELNSAVLLSAVSLFFRLFFFIISFPAAILVSFLQWQCVEILTYMLIWFWFRDRPKGASKQSQSLAWLNCL